MLFAGLALGCAARVPVELAAAPSVAVPDAVVSVVSVDRDCRAVADALTSALRSMDGMAVHPNAPTRVNILACNTSWADTGEQIEVRSQAIAAISADRGVLAKLLGASSEVLRGEADGTIALRKSSENLLVEGVAQDLAEQIAPVPTRVHRKVYENPSAGSARQYHNLAVAAEREGRIDDAVWWATQAWEERPTSRRARYVAELTRRRSRIGITLPEIAATR